MDLTHANEPQKAAIMHLRGPCLVLAGPGSGKTYTITNRILYLLERGIPPESILVITFMKEAALSMQHRFLEMSAQPSGSAAAGGGNPGLKAYYPVNFGTFHSVFYHILKESNVLKSNQLLSNSEKKNLILPILKAYEKKRSQEAGEKAAWIDPGSLNEDAAKILAAVSFYKNTMQISEAAEKASSSWQPYFEEICREYEDAVKETGRLDFDDMLYNCRRFLQENGAAREYWQKRFRHILIDEFQDINPVQYETVKLLASGECNLFAVGDDDQSIYGFRGSRPECLRRFAEEYGARQILLDVNYRSRPEIVRASLAVIGENKDRFVKNLRAAGSSGAGKADVAIRSFPGREEQYACLVRMLQEAAQTRESCAVLFRTNSYMQGFAARLKAADIPYEMKEHAVSIYEHFIVKDIMAYLQIAHGEGDREQLLRIMNKPSRYLSREALGKAGVKSEDSTAVPLLGAMKKYYDTAQLPESQRQRAGCELERLERQLKSVKGFLLRPAVSYILKAMGYEEYLKGLSKANPKKFQEWQELLEWLKEDAAAYKSLREWKSAQEEYAKSMEQHGEGEKRRKPSGRAHGGEQGERKGKNAVQLLTVHGAKGLEFDRVWIPDCNEKIFPHGTMPDEKTAEEERRIFYVAMTRAKKSLELLYLTGTKERPRLPSRFLNPIIKFYRT